MRESLCGRGGAVGQGTESPICVQLIVFFLRDLSPWVLTAEGRRGGGEGERGGHRSRRVERRGGMENTIKWNVEGGVAVAFQSCRSVLCVCVCVCILVCVCVCVTHPRISHKDSFICRST